MKILRNLLYTPDSQENDCTLTEDDVYSVLSSSRRRAVIDIINDNQGEMALREVASAVGDRDGADVETIYVSLYQSHLPILAKHDIITWDREDNVVSSGPYVGQLAEVIDATTRVLA